jgi:hypothetical protein
LPDLTVLMAKLVMYFPACYNFYIEIDMKMF